ncbi:MAG: hypothetical protein KAS32_19970 [Candidatus Peribacteraceae bacterium]|nr:hypothetical protein [Candidatus Peribacteraceae bacterium]
MKLKDAMGVVALLIEKASGMKLNVWDKKGYMFNKKSMSLAFKVISGKAKHPNLIKAWDELKKKYEGNTHIVVAFSKDEDIEPVVCLRLTTFLWYVARSMGIPNNLNRPLLEGLSAEIVSLEMGGCRKLGRI